jgi:hypothetical protein
MDWFNFKDPDIKDDLREQVNPPDDRTLPGKTYATGPFISLCQ